MFSGRYVGRFCSKMWFINWDPKSDMHRTIISKILHSCDTPLSKLWYKVESFCALNCTEHNSNVSLYFKEYTLRHLLTICFQLHCVEGLPVARGVIN